MPKELSELAASGCPWLQDYSVAAWAGEAVVRLFDPALAFASPKVRRLFAARAGFSLRLPLPGQTQAPDEARFLAALLAKLAQRGLPAPCSLAIERRVLEQAAAAEVLDFEENSATGEF